MDRLRKLTMLRTSLYLVEFLTQNDGKTDVHTVINKHKGRASASITNLPAVLFLFDLITNAKIVEQRRFIHNN